MAGRYQEASEALEKALKIKPDLVTAHENLIRISLRGQIHPTFWDFWNSSKYKRIVSITIMSLSIFLIAYPLAKTIVMQEDRLAVPPIPIQNIIGIGILTVILLSPILSGAKVGPLEFTFLDSQRSAQPLSSAM